MDWFKTGLTSCVGFVIAVVVAICIEHCGGAVGGIIASVPTTIVPTSYIFLSDEGVSKEVHAQSLFSSPIGRFHNSVLF